MTHNSLDKLAFIHVPKNAGTSITDALKKYNIKCYYHDSDPRTISFDHILVLRDPIDRFCSAVNFAIQYWSHLPHIQNILNAGLHTANDWLDHFFDTDAKYFNLIQTEVLNGYHNIGNFIPKYKWTYTYQHYYICNPRYVIMFDDLKNELQYLLNQFNIGQLDLPKYNVSRHDCSISTKNKKLLTKFYEIDTVLYYGFKNKHFTDRLSVSNIDYEGTRP